MTAADWILVALLLCFAPFALVTGYREWRRWRGDA